MARTGGFGGRLPTLRPFGGGGTFAQYDIGQTASQLADLATYKAEIAWGNGQLDDASYLAALKAAWDRADPDTEKKLSAQNKYEDAVYRIGRAQVQARNDPEALIAFDQTSLAKMNPNNLRYNDLHDTLNTELANRRSKQYGDLVDQYNAGKVTTQTLLAWVKKTRGALPPGSPDADNWRQTERDLGDRIQTETDATKAQDYQHGRLKPKDYLAYVKGRRDSYLNGSPSFADWNRRLEDIGTQIHDQALADADKKFFDAYNAGKKSDLSYLAYIRERIGKMKPDDPSLLDWQHRLETAVYSISEDKLRLDVSENKRPAEDLISFYQAYQRTLNPSSPEWRSVQAKVDEAKQVASGQTEAVLRFKAENPGIAVTQPQAQGSGVDLGGGVVSHGGSLGSTPAAGGGGAAMTVPHGATITKPASGSYRYGGVAEEFQGGRYTKAQIDYVANRIAAGTGLDPRVTRLWVMKEQGHANNPLGVSQGGDAGQLGILSAFSSIDKGIDEAIRWVNTHSNMRVIKDAVGKSPQEQINALDHSPWGPGGGRGGYNGSLQQLASQVGFVMPGPTGSSPPGVITPGSLPGGPQPVQPVAPGAATKRIPTGDEQRLIDFYQHQVDTLPKGTPEWRTAYDKLQSATKSATTPDAVDKQLIGPDTPTKAISPKATLETIAHQIAIGAQSSPFSIANYETNHDNITNAFQRGDKVWLFFDPAKPNAITFARHGDGSFALDAKGKRIPIRGSGYYPVTSQAVARIEQLHSNYYFQLSEAARANGQNTDAITFQNKALESLDKLRGLDNRLRKEALQAALQGDAKHSGILGIIDHAWATADLETVWNMTQNALGIVSALDTSPEIDDARKGQLHDIATKLTSNPLFPDESAGRLGAFDPLHSDTHLDATGRPVVDKLALGPGTHLVFKFNQGVKTFEVVDEGALLPGMWDENHVKVHVAFGDKVRTAEAEVVEHAPIDPHLVINAPGGVQKTLNLKNTVRAAAFFDGTGNTQYMYTLDGQSWIKSNGATAPAAELNDSITEARLNEGGKTLSYYGNGGMVQETAFDPGERPFAKPLLETDLDGNVLKADLTSLTWYGQRQAEQQAATDPFSDTAIQRLVTQGATAAEIRSAILGATDAQGNYHPSSTASGFDVGAPGQHMTLAFADSDRSVNMLPPAKARPHGPVGISGLGFAQQAGVQDLLGMTPREIADSERQASDSQIAVSQDLMTQSRGNPNAKLDRQYARDAARLAGPTQYQRQFTITPTGRAFGGSWGDQHFALSSQLPATTPARYAGYGLDGLHVPMAAPPKPISPLATRRPDAKPIVKPLKPIPALNASSMRPYNAPPVRPLPKPKPKPVVKLKPVAKAAPLPMRPYNQPPTPPLPMRPYNQPAPAPTPKVQTVAPKNAARGQ